MEKFKINFIEGKDFIFDSDENWKDRMDMLSCLPIRIEFRDFNEETLEDGELAMSIDGMFFNFEYMRNYDIQLFEIFDSISKVTCNLYEALFDKEDYKEEIELWNENLFYIDKIFVEEKYREKGYMADIIESLDKILKYIGRLNIGIIATYVFHDGKDNKVKNKIKEVLNDNGYCSINNNDDYLYKIVLDD